MITPLIPRVGSDIGSDSIESGCDYLLEYDGLGK
jgi:hypothetical protein